MLLRLSEKVSTIDAIDRGTAALAETFKKIRTQPLEQLKRSTARSDALAVQADNAHGAALGGMRDQFDTLAWLFKQTSDILIPLSKEGVLLPQYRHNLKQLAECDRKSIPRRMEGARNPRRHPSGIVGDRVCGRRGLAARGARLCT